LTLVLLTEIVRVVFFVVSLLHSSVHFCALNVNDILIWSSFLVSRLLRVIFGADFSFDALLFLDHLAVSDKLFIEKMLPVLEARDEESLACFVDEVVQVGVLKYFKRYPETVVARPQLDAVLQVKPVVFSSAEDSEHKVAHSEVIAHVFVEKVVRDKNARDGEADDEQRPEPARIALRTLQGGDDASQECEHQEQQEEQKESQILHLLCSSYEPVEGRQCIRRHPDC